MNMIKCALQMAQLNEVELKKPCCRLGAQPLNTIHIWPRSSTAPQPDGFYWESILRRKETGVPGENPRSQVEIDWNSILIQHFVVEVKGVIDVYYAWLPRWKSLLAVLYICLLVILHISAYENVVLEHILFVKNNFVRKETSARS